MGNDRYAASYSSTTTEVDGASIHRTQSNCYCCYCGGVQWGILKTFYYCIKEAFSLSSHTRFLVSYSILHYMGIPSCDRDYRDGNRTVLQSDGSPCLFICAFPRCAQFHHLHVPTVPQVQESTSRLAYILISVRMQYGFSTKCFGWSQFC